MTNKLEYCFASNRKQYKYIEGHEITVLNSKVGQRRSFHYVNDNHFLLLYNTD